MSGLQKEVLSLYRTILRAAAKKDGTTATTATTGPIMKVVLSSSPESLPKSTLAYARQEFRKQAQQIDRKDFRTIEYKIRHGYKQVKLLQMPGVKMVGGGGGGGK